MARYLATVDSPLAPEDAFGYLAAFQHIEEWDPGVVEAEQRTTGEVRVGTSFRLVLTSAGRKMPLTYLVTELDPGHRIVLEARTRTFISHDEITVTPRGRGCRVVYDAELRLRGPLRLLDPVMRIAFQRIGDRAADGLRAALTSTRERT